MPPLSVIVPGQEIAMPWRVPPKNDGICLVHLYGVSNAQAHGTAMCWIGLVGAPDVVEFHLLFRDRQLDAVELQRSRSACRSACLRREAPLSPLM